MVPGLIGMSMPLFVCCAERRLRLSCLYQHLSASPEVKTVACASHLLRNAEAVRARRLEEAEREEDEGGADVEHVEPVVVDEQVRGQRLLAPRVVRELVVVLALLQEDGRLLVVHLPLTLQVALAAA